MKCFFCHNIPKEKIGNEGLCLECLWKLRKLLGIEKIEGFLEGLDRDMLATAQQLKKIKTRNAT